MSRGAVARNYAGTLYELGARHEATGDYGELLEQVAVLYREVEEFRLFLETPRVPLEAKQEAIREALGPEAPEPFVRFLLVVLEKRRQGLLPEIAQAYGGLLDEAAGRVHATVLLPFTADETLRGEIVARLERSLDKTVVPHFRVDPGILGGVRIRVGDKVMDGSLRRRLEDLRRELSATPT